MNRCRRWSCVYSEWLHAFVVGSGCKAIPHPEVPGTTKRPDFLVTDQAGTPVAYVEVTTVNPSLTEDAERRRENPVYNAIELTATVWTARARRHR
jgi:hypothetical protein